MVLVRVLLTVVALLATGAGSGAAVQVNLKQGVFSGETLDAGDGRQVYSFRGIPYAKPPVGNLRFKDPEPFEAWHGTKESSTPPQCPQVLFESIMKGESEVGGEEDCLYLHVYTPTLCGKDLLPVMVFIHGGGFVAGNPDQAGGTPLPLLTKDIVLVSPQYRLGTLGFLSTGDSFLPGNMGLKDQTLALQWVRDNIRSFGGDPNKVTIFGVSAGGGSVSLQMLTPKSEGLFQRAIMQSGSALASWVIRSDHKRVAARVARQMECSGVEAPDGSLDGAALMSCLQAVPFKDLVLASTAIENWNFFPMYMVPRVDGDYLPAHPTILLREGHYHKVDVISGVCQHEGLFPALAELDEAAQEGIVQMAMRSETECAAVATPVGEQLLESFPTLAPISVGLDQEERSLYLARRIYYHYLGDGNITFTEKNMDQLVQMYGDMFVAVAQDLTSQFLARDAAYGKNVYLYQLEHLGESPLTSVWINTTIDLNWVGHGDDLPYLFSDVLNTKPLKRQDDLYLSEIMVDLWTTFAATGNPTPDLSLGFRWIPATPSSLHYLSLKPAAVMQPDPRAEIRAFLSDLPTKQNMMLFPEKFPAKVVVQKDDREYEHCHV